MAVEFKNKANEKKNSATNFALNKTNFILMAACLVLIIVGFFMMCGSPNEGTTFNEDIFNSTRTIVGPTIALLGFVLMAFAIMYKKKNKNNEVK